MIFRSDQLAMFVGRCWLFIILVGAGAGRASAGNFATSVVHYTSGTGVEAVHLDAGAALGSPSVNTVDPQLGTLEVNPFAGPFLGSQVVSVGEGGSLTVQFDCPVRDNSANLYGLDFSIYGNSYFEVDEVSFTTATGVLGGGNPGETAVSVSADNVTYFRLDPSFAPKVDGLFPTDGPGDFGRPVNPALRPVDFTGKGLAETRVLYGGSGGGTAFDIAWARDDQGNPADLGSIQYVRVDVLRGRSDLDAFGALTPVPEPTSVILVGVGLLLGWVGRRRR